MARYGPLPLRIQWVRNLKSQRTICTATTTSALANAKRGHDRSRNIRLDGGNANTASNNSMLQLESQYIILPIHRRSSQTDPVHLPRFYPCVL